MTDSDRFETHLTLAAASIAGPSDDDRSLIKEWATARNMKWTHIVLSSGQNASQPMIFTGDTSHRAGSFRPETSGPF